MNGGTNRGQADGFQLSVLNKVRDVKTQVGNERNLGFILHSQLLSKVGINPEKFESNSKLSPTYVSSTEQNVKSPFLLLNLF